MTLPGSKPTILTVDDSRTMRNMLRLALTDAGHTVIEAEDGMHGVEVLGGSGGVKDPNGSPLAASFSWSFTTSAQGAQFPNMGRGLYDSESVFRAAFDDGAAALKRARGLDLRDILYSSRSVELVRNELNQTALAQYHSPVPSSRTARGSPSSSASRGSRSARSAKPMPPAG